MTPERLDTAGYACPVEGLGPGQRLILWVRGCRIGCPGCIAPELQAFGTPVLVSDVAEELRPLVGRVDGLTISGGEPFDQAAGLSALIDRLRETSDIEVLVYTGYPLDDLRGLPDAAPLLERTDILIDQPYIESKPNTLQWRGSDNQTVHLLTERARRYAAVKDIPFGENRHLQVQMLGTDRFRIIGIPKRGDLATYRALMAARNIAVRPDYGNR